MPLNEWRETKPMEVIGMSRVDVSSTRYAFAVVKRMSKKVGCEDGVHVRIQLQACGMFGHDKSDCDAECGGCDEECLVSGKCAYCECYLKCPDCNYTEHGFSWSCSQDYTAAQVRQHRLQMGEGHDSWSAFGDCEHPECAGGKQIPIFVDASSPAFVIS